MYYFSPSRLVFIKDSKIWSDAVVVSDTVYNEIRQQLNEGWTLSAAKNGQPLMTEPAVPLPLPSVNSVYMAQLAKMNADYETMVAYFKRTYPYSESITWPVQRDEAVKVMAWLDEDHSRIIDDFPRSRAPFIYDLAALRTHEGVGGGLLDLCNRVLINDAIFSPALAAITARRHAAEKLMMEGVTNGDRDAIKAVTWSFNLQG